MYHVPNPTQHKSSRDNQSHENNGIESNPNHKSDLSTYKMNSKIISKTSIPVLCGEHDLLPTDEDIPV